MGYHIEVSVPSKSETGKGWRESGTSALWGLTNRCCGQGASEQSPERARHRPGEEWSW